MPRILTCTACNNEFDRGYNISSKRAENAQLCSAECRTTFFKSRYKIKDFNGHFWGLVNKPNENECWEWSGRKDPERHGRIDIDGKPRLSHRIAYLLTHGSVPEDMLAVLSPL